MLKTRTTRGRWPGAFVRRGAFTLDRGQGPALWQRTKGGLKMLYLLKPSVAVPARWPIAEQVTRVVEWKWPTNAIEALERAIATAK
jgi:hypothetical protein